MPLISITIEATWLGGKRVGLWALGPGFESQVPQNVYLIFFFRCSHAMPRRWSTVCIQFPSARWPVNQIQWPKLSIHHTLQSTHTHGSGEVNQANAFGPGFLINQPPFLGPDPFWFALFFFFLSIFLLPNLFIIFNQLTN